MRKIVKRLIIPLAIIFIVIFLLILNSGKKPEKFEYGVTFSAMQAQSLGLDWKQTYSATLDDLGARLIRIPVYWNRVEIKEGEYDFEDLDYQLRLAREHGAKVVLTVGQRVPRWPECFQPDWVKNLPSGEAKENALLSFIGAVVTRYYADSAVAMWQVENEPFLGTFGECPKPDKNLLDREIALVKKIDPSRQILISDSGELSSWLNASARGDLFGTTLYRYVFSDVFKRYWVNYIPYWFYRLKGGYVRLLHPGKQIAIIELQAEPWTTKGIQNTSIEEQFKTMSMQKFENILNVARATGYNPQYLWGVEWWYWMKTTQNHPEFWDKAKSLMQN